AGNPVFHPKPKAPNISSEFFNGLKLQFKKSGEKFIPLHKKQKRETRSSTQTLSFFQILFYFSTFIKGRSQTVNHC
ncbi:MAG: hypothetical protein JXJ22_13020, partial [Bacteroidales bacterium]|nr:hypothetical protein [Bacteroidales bacterium]